MGIGGANPPHCCQVFLLVTRHSEVTWLITRYRCCFGFLCLFFILVARDYVCSLRQTNEGREWDDEVVVVGVVAVEVDASPLLLPRVSGSSLSSFSHLFTALWQAASTWAFLLQLTRGIVTIWEYKTCKKWSTGRAPHQHAPSSCIDRYWGTDSESNLQPSNVVNVTSQPELHPPGATSYSESTLQHPEVENGGCNFTPSEEVL